MFAPCSNSNAPPGCAASGFYARARHQVGALFKNLHRNAHRQVVGIGTCDAEVEPSGCEALREGVDLFRPNAPLVPGQSQLHGGTSRRGDDARHKSLSLSAHGVLHTTIANFHGGGSSRELRLDFEVPPIVEDETRRLLAEAALDAAAAFDDFLREGVGRQD